MKHILFLSSVLLVTTSSIFAQSKIKDGSVTGSATLPSSNSILELESTNKGLKLPRVELTSTTSASPLTAHEAGMLVYNTNTANDVTPGNYYNDGTKWVRLVKEIELEWVDKNVNGVDLILARQAAASGDTVVVTDNGKLGIGTPNPIESLTVNGTASTLFETNSGRYSSVYSGNNGLGLGFSASALINIPNKNFNVMEDEMYFTSVIDNGVSVGYNSNLIKDSISSVAYFEKDKISIDHHNRVPSTNDRTASFLNFNDNSSYIGYDVDSIASGKQFKSSVELKREGVHLENFVESPVGGIKNSGVFSMYGNSNIFLGRRVQNLVTNYGNQSGVDFRNPDQSLSEVYLHSRNEDNGKNAYLAFETSETSPMQSTIALVANLETFGPTSTVDSGASVRIEPSKGIIFEYNGNLSTYGKYEFPRSTGDSLQVFTSDGNGKILWTDPMWKKENGYLKANNDTTGVNPVVITENGKIGVGISNPSEKVEVEGAVKISDGGYTGITNNSSANPPVGGAGTIIFSGGNFFGWNGTVWKQLDN